MSGSDPIIYSTTGEQPDDPECELDVNTLVDGTVLVSTGERAPGGAETWADWDRDAESFLRGIDSGGQRP